MQEANDDTRRCDESSNNLKEGTIEQDKNHDIIQFGFAPDLLVASASLLSTPRSCRNSRSFPVAQYRWHRQYYS
jgi:hypothetical protein